MLHPPTKHLLGSPRVIEQGGRTLQLYAKAPAHPGQPPRQRLEMVRLTHLQSVYIEDLSFHLVLPTMTMTFVAPTEVGLKYLSS